MLKWELLSKRKEVYEEFPDFARPPDRVVPPSRFSTALTAFGSHVLLFGGISQDHDVLGDTWILDRSHGENGWMQVIKPLNPEEDRPVPSRRSGHRIAYVPAQPTADIDLNDFDYITSTEKSEETKPPQPSSEGSHVYLFGGADVDNELFYGDLWEFDQSSIRPLQSETDASCDVVAGMQPDKTFTSNRCLALWKLIEPISRSRRLPCARWHHSLNACPGNVFLFGGQGSDYSLLSDLHIFNTERQSWLNIRTDVAHPASRQLHASACSMDGQLVIAGGDGAQNDLHDVWMFDSGSMSWREMRYRGLSPFNPLPRGGTKRPILGAGGAMVGSKYFLLLGGFDGESVANDVWLFDIVSEIWVKIPNSQYYSASGPLADLPGVSFPTVSPHRKKKSLLGDDEENLALLSKIHMTTPHENGSLLDFSSHVPFEIDRSTPLGSLYYASVRSDRPQLAPVGAKLPETLTLTGVNTTRYKAHPPVDPALHPAHAAECSSKAAYPSVMEGRWKHGVCTDAHTRSVLTYGGFNNVEIFDDLWKLDFMFKDDMPRPRKSSKEQLPQQTQFQFLDNESYRQDTL
eukprot:Rmarinus@m.11092